MVYLDKFGAFEPTYLLANALTLTENLQGLHIATTAQEHTSNLTIALLLRKSCFTLSAGPGNVRHGAGAEPGTDN
jgi:hypothetical protein